jgi:hypothetical protein
MRQRRVAVPMRGLRTRNLLVDQDGIVIGQMADELDDFADRLLISSNRIR